MSKCSLIFFRKKNPLSLFLLIYIINISHSVLTHTEIPTHVYVLDVSLR